MDEAEKIKDIKDQILDKIELELRFITDTSTGGGDIYISETIKNLADAYVSLSKVGGA